MAAAEGAIASAAPLMDEQFLTAARAVLEALDPNELAIGEEGTVGGDLALYSIFNTVPPELTNALVNEMDAGCATSVFLDRCVGAVIGMAAGDALGARAARRERRALLDAAGACMHTRFCDMIFMRA